MKQRKQIMVDEDLMPSLRGVDSASGLINSLLKEYFKESSNMTLDRLKQVVVEKTGELVKLETEIKEVKNRIHEINTYEDRIKTIFKKMPSEIINDFKDFPLMTEEVLKNRFENMYSIKFNIKYSELLKVFKEYFKGRKEVQNGR